MGRILALGALLLVRAAPLSAQAPEPVVEPGPPAWAALSGSARAGYWSSSRTRDDREHFATAALWLKAAPRLAEKAALLVEGWVMNQDLFHEDATGGRWREAYIDLGLGPFDVRLGKQIVAWGRADRVNPTDVVSPRDFTLLVPDDDDQRFGVAALKATYYAGTVSVTGLWLAEFEPHVTPIPRPDAPFTTRERVPADPVAQWAVKLDHTGGGFDWSLSYFDGFDPFPDLGIDRVTPAGVELILRHHRIRVVGADAATTVGRYGLRGEAAYTFTEDPAGDNPQVKNPFFFMVVGGDRTVAEHLNINLQYIFRYVVHFRSPVDISNPVERGVATQQAVASNQLDRIQHGAAVRISHRWLNDTLEGEVASILSLTRLDYVLRPKLTYALTDRLKGVVGADVFRGPPRSFLGNLRENTTVYAELRWSF
jgi:uncharacterized protein DUF1302